MERYVCPPWYECRCLLGKPVSRSTMLSHRREANKNRSELGLGLFAWGPKVQAADGQVFSFSCMDYLVDHPADHGARRNLVLKGNLFVYIHTANFSDSFRVSPNLQAEHSPNVRNFSTTPELALNSNESSPPYQIQAVADVDHVLDDVEMMACPAQPSTFQSCTEPSSSEAPASNALVAQDDRSLDLSRVESSSPNEILSDDLEVDSDTGPDTPSSSEELVSLPEHNGPASDVLGTSASDFTVSLPSFSGSRRNPELLPWLYANRDWVETFHRHALEEVVMDEILAKLGAPCKQWKTAMSNISAASGLSESMEIYATCPGHMAFVPDPTSETIQNCSDCGAAPPSQLNGDNTYSYLPIIPRLRAMIQNENACNQMYDYRANRVSDATSLRDYFDGEAFHELCVTFGGEDGVKNDIFLLASTDGFSPFKNRSYDVWSIAAINFNLPPDKRYLPQNVLPLAFVPGPTQPKNIQSFLLPLVFELRSAGEGVMMTFPDDSERSVRVHLIAFTGDQPAVCKVSGLVGHNGRSPCRDCNIHGYYSNHYYFPSKIKIDSGRTRVLFNLRNLPMRTTAESVSSIQLIETKSGTERKLLQTNCGIRENSVLFALPTIVPYSSFPHDIMHTFYNIQNDLLGILLGPHDDDFSISRSSLDALDIELLQWKWGISGQLGPKPKPLSKYRDWKAAEHKVFSLSYSLVIFDGYLPDEYLQGLQLFSLLVDICTRAEVQRGDVQILRTTAFKFVEHFERCYFKFRADRANFCKSVIHILLHLADCMQRYGPLIGVSQYWVEGYIGWVGRRNTSRTRPAQSMTKKAMFNDAFKIFYETGVYEKPSAFSEVTSAGGFVLIGAPKAFRSSRFPDSGRQVRGIIADYLCRKYTLSANDAVSIASEVEKVWFYSGIRFLVGEDTQSASVYTSIGGSGPKISRNRPSCYVAVEMQGSSDQFHEVWYGRLLRLMTFDLSASVLHNHTSITQPHHEVAVLDWAEYLRKGSHGQVYTNGRVQDAFSGATAEDLCVIRRLIKSVEHRVPRGETASRYQRARKRTYFLDDAVWIDHLLSMRVPSLDEVNRFVKGFVG